MVAHRKQQCIALLTVSLLLLGTVAASADVATAAKRGGAKAKNAGKDTPTKANPKRSSSSSKADKKQTQRAVVQPQQGSLSDKFICDGKLHELVIPAAPYPESSPFNNPYNNPPGITCSRPNGGFCGAQERVDCDDTGEAASRNATGNIIRDIGPVNQNGDGTSLLSPLNPLRFTMDPALNQYLTFVDWMVYDVGTGGAKLVGNYAADGGLQPDVNSYQWVPNGKQDGPNGTQFCGPCSSCTVGEGVTNMTLASRPGTGYSSIEVSQLYVDVSCAATCANLDGSYWTGMKYRCIQPTCGDTDLSQLGEQNYVCPANYEYNPKQAQNTTVDQHTCCRFAPTCGNTDPTVPNTTYPCAAQGCLEPPFEDQCWTNNPNAGDVPLTGNDAVDLVNCCNQPTDSSSAGDVYVTKVADPPIQQAVGSTWQFTLLVGVNGLSDAIVRDVVLTDRLPAGLLLESVTEDPFENACATTSGTSFQCSWPFILKADPPKRITLKVTATTAGEFENVARVRAPNDTNPDNNEGTDRIRATGACCNPSGPSCTNTLPEDCAPPRIFTPRRPCSAVDCVPVPESEGSCCLPTFGQCVDRTEQAACLDAGGRWTRSRLCSDTPDCEPPTGACCNVKTGSCYEDRSLTECELEVSTWKRDGSCTSDGYCSGSCCDTNSGSCVQARKSECLALGSVWSIYQQCNILTCPRNDVCIPPWWQCRPPMWGEQDPCCPGYSCQSTYKKCKAGAFVCKPRTPEPSCVPEFHSCGGFSNGVCCPGLACMWDHKRHKGTCMQYSVDYVQHDGGKCKKDKHCARGYRCAYGRCKSCDRDSCHRECFDYKCFEERKKDCAIFYATAASL